MVMNKKGQAAMEFLMTYGWAILVVLIAIGALAYFGVVDQSNRLPEVCLFPSGFDCVGVDAFTVDAATDSVTFVLINNKGSPIDIIGYSDDVNDDCDNPVLTGCPGGGCTPAALPFRVVNNGKMTFKVTCQDTDIVVGRFKLNPDIKYNNTNSGLTRGVQGQITGRAT